jgi:hypothetical protein
MGDLHDVVTPDEWLTARVDLLTEATVDPGP